MTRIRFAVFYFEWSQRYWFAKTRSCSCVGCVALRGVFVDMCTWEVNKVITDPFGLCCRRWRERKEHSRKTNEDHTQRRILASRIVYLQSKLITGTNVRLIRLVSTAKERYNWNDTVAKMFVILSLSLPSLRTCCLPWSTCWVGWACFESTWTIPTIEYIYFPSFVH